MPKQESGPETVFERRLDVWLSTYRVTIGGFGLALVMLLVPEEAWLLQLAIGYFIAAVAVFPALRFVGNHEHARLTVRLVVLLLDVGTVALLGAKWGARTSPGALMYVPIVVGWTLLPQRALGRLALFLVIGAFGSQVWVETLAVDGAPPWLANASAPRGGLLFGLAASTFLAVHSLLAHTVTQLRQHTTLVGSLRAAQHAREREAQLATQLEEAQRLEALGRPAGGIAHEFNNLLTVVMGCTQLAQQVLRTHDAGARGLLENVFVAAERGSSLTTQLLDFASRRPAAPRDLELNSALSSSESMLRRLLPPSVRLHLDLCTRPSGVRMDPSSLDRVLVNLVASAADAMPDGGDLTIVVGGDTSAAGDSVRLEVRDSGPRIEAADIPFIFEPFFARHSRERGTGLALSSVYGIVRQTQGTIEVARGTEQGNVFVLRWPRVDVAAPTSVVAARPAADGRGSVLVVDDNQAVRDVVAEHLRSAGFEVQAVSSGAEALARLSRAHAFILLVSDVSMPGMSGLELARALRERGSQIPILLMSGYADELARDISRAQLGAAFLAKPFTSERLLAEVSSLLNTQTTNAHAKTGLESA